MKKIEIKRAAKNVSEWFGKYIVANLFLVIALCAGIAMAVITPPFQECDGWEHYLRALDVSYGNLFSPLAVISHDSGEMIIPENFGEISYRIIESDSGEGQEYISELKKITFSKDTTTMEYGEGMMSFFYYPQALGLALSRLFGMSVYGGVVLSRIFNLLAFLILAYAAIRITPVLKNTFAVLGLFPMTVFQAASDSPDALLNGLCFLFVALCLFYAYGERERLGWKDVLKLGVLLAFIFLCKYVYVCLGLLVFLIPMKKFGTKKEYWKCFVIALIPLIIMGGIAFMGMTSAVTSGQATAGTGGMTQSQYLMEHPKFILQVLITTFMAKFTDYMLWLNMLGSLNYSLGPLIYIVPMFALFVAGMDSNEICDKIKVKDKLLCLCAFLLVSVGIVMGIYIGDGRINEVGALVVQGVQGRYFIAALPAFFVAINQKGIHNRVKYFSQKMVGCMGVLLLWSVLILKVHCA